MDVSRQMLQPAAVEGKEGSGTFTFLTNSNQKTNRLLSITKKHQNKYHSFLMWLSKKPVCGERKCASYKCSLFPY